MRKKGAFSGKINISSQEERVKGFRHFMKDQAKIESGVLTQRDFCREAAHMIKSGGEKTAFLCSSDVHAIELLEYFQNEGIPVPESAGIMGFDNLDLLIHIKPRLTTTSTSIEEVGRESLNKLFKLIRGEKVPRTSHIPHGICPGGSL
jgi:DNA-binding LacI/PurR family transcriptional regulator